jgi:hypothetical protein
MYRLVRFVISLALILAFAYFAVTVPLGKHTLWGHIVRIARSPEAKDLAEGARDTAREAARRAERELDAQGAPPSHTQKTPAPAKDSP